MDAVWKLIAADLDTYVGRVFEEVCRRWLGRYSELESATSATAIGSWWSRDGRHEIDIACADRRQYTLLGLMQVVAASGVDEDVLKALLSSREVVEGRAADAQLALFARRGFTQRLQRRAARDGVLLVTAADLFA